MSARTSESVGTAVQDSTLRNLQEDVIAGLMRGARSVRIAARATILPPGGSAPHFDLVMRGLVRVQVSAADGRMMTVRYCRCGDLLGAATLYAPVVRPFSIQAISEAELLRFRPEVVREQAERDPDVARALLVETSERVMGFVGEFSGQAFARVRERIARHLLDLALDGPAGPGLVAAVSQQELADAVGSVREVVVRALRELRAEGAVETGRAGIVIADPERLAGLAGLSWNEGS